MSFYKYFFRIYRYFTFKAIRNSSKNKPDVEEWKRILNSIPEPLDDTERSFARYLCRMHYFSPLYKFLANSVAFFALLLSIPSLLKNNRDKQKSSDDCTPEGCILVKITKIKEFEVGYSDILPAEIEEKFGKIKVLVKPEKIEKYLTEDARRMIWISLRRRPFHFLFNYWLFRELSFYSGILDTYHPRAIAVYVNERNIAAPMVSELCEKRGVDFVSFMHGDYIMQLIQAFMRFTRYYAWDEHYVNMFVEDLRCEPSQFVVYKPKKYQGICKPRESGQYEFFATYYFGNENKALLEKIAEAFNILKTKGFECKVRPHPRAINLSSIREIFKEFVIEDPYSTSLASSMENSRYILALNSTVLSEALYSGKDIVIDDYSDPEAYHNLKLRKYINIYKPHKRLSELIE